MKLVLVGAREDGQAHLVLELLEEVGEHRAVGLLDETKELWGTEVLGLPVWGGPERVAEAREAGAAGAVICVGDSLARCRLATVMTERGFELPSLVHPRAYVAASARIGRGVFVGAMAVVSTGARVGDLALIPPSALVSHHAQVADCVSLSPGVRLGGRSRIESGAFLGLGALVLPDRTVGKEAVVGAGAVVVNDVAPGATVAGVPARRLR